MNKVLLPRCVSPNPPPPILLPLTANPHKPPIEGNLFEKTQKNRGNYGKLRDVVDKLKYYHLSDFALKIRNLLKLVNNVPHFLLARL